MDMNLKMPVYFFISDVTAIKECSFGSVDSESSGSTQRNVLKEEFYRTCMVICGKIPLWWLCYDNKIRIDYSDALSAIEDEDFWEYDIIDFGDLENVGKEEYFGAALWQFHKSLSSPLKSIIKLSLLQMLLEAPQEMLLCHQFREKVLSSKSHILFPDHSVFSITSILSNYRETKKEMLTFLIDCFFIRSEINMYNKRQTLKNRLISDFLKEYPIDRERRASLRDSVSWGFKSQVELGNKLFKLLLKIYREISAAHTGVEGEIDRRDITILGRKISAFYLKKRHKIPVLQRPTGTLNITDLTLELNDKIWNIFQGSDRASPLVSNTNIIYNIAFAVWNNIFLPNSIHMRPNASSVTLQEAINVGKKIGNFFGTYDSLDIELFDYLKKECITKLLVILDFETSPWYKQAKDFRVVYMNCWGELFSRRFSSSDKFEEFLRESSKERKDIEISYYIQRNSTMYEKTIARTKKILLASIET
jgi:adenylate cyclase class 1